MENERPGSSVVCPACEPAFRHSLAITEDAFGLIPLNVVQTA